MQSKLNNSYPPRLYAWLVVLILLLANICSFVDRMILTLLVEPIKADLSLSDTQIGLLHGFAFAAFYALMGLPIGRLADRVHRRNVIVIGITLWSFMTAFCGLARNFLTLFLARMGTGVGEATFNPCAFPLLADYFPKSTRSKAMSLVAIGPYFGGGLSFVLGGLVLAWVTEMGMISMPYIGEIKPWQMTFFIVGAPGILIGLLVLLVVREPRRHEKIAGDAQGEATLEWKDTFRFVYRNINVYALITAGAAFNILVAYAVNGWTPTLFIRVYEWEAARIGTIFGLIYMIFGSCGTFIGGVIGDMLYRKGHFDAVYQGDADTHSRGCANRIHAAAVYAGILVAMSVAWNPLSVYRRRTANHSPDTGNAKRIPRPGSGDVFLLPVCIWRGGGSGCRRHHDGLSFPGHCRHSILAGTGRCHRHSPECCDALVLFEALWQNAEGFSTYVGILILFQPRMLILKNLPKP